MDSLTVGTCDTSVVFESFQFIEWTLVGRSCTPRLLEGSRRIETVIGPAVSQCTSTEGEGQPSPPVAPRGSTESPDIRMSGHPSPPSNDIEGEVQNFINKSDFCLIHHDQPPPPPLHNVGSNISTTFLTLPLLFPVL